jgi:PilZ domain
VDRRFDHRYFTDAEIAVTTLSDPGRYAHGRMTDLSNNGMAVLVPLELAEGDIVQLQIGDSTLFGFVVHSAREGDSFRAGIELQRVLIGGSDLSKVLYGALRQVMPELPGVAVSV